MSTDHTTPETDESNHFPEIGEINNAPKDPKDFSQLRRLESIHNSRERVLQKRREAKDLVAYGELRPDAANDIIREAVQDYIVDIEGLDESGDLWGFYWEECPLGEQYVECVDRVIEYEGLDSILNSPNPFVFEWTEATSPPPGYAVHPDGQQRHQSKTVQIDDRILINAYRACNSFLAEMGLDLEMEESEMVVMAFDEVPLEVDDDEVEYVPAEEWQEEVALSD